MHKELKLHLED